MNRNRNRNHPVRKPALTAALAFAATLLALPVSSALAQSFPDFPLQTGAGNIEPNIMFILDDSGSMAFENMPNPDLSSVCRRNNSGGCAGNTITHFTYTSNTIYYDPAADYDPWVTTDGSQMTGGTTLQAVYGSFNHAGSGHGGESDTIDLTDTGSCETYDRNGSNTTVCGGVQTFYVPKDTSQTGSTYLRETRNYYRYQIRMIGGVPRMVRSELVLGGGYGDFPPVANVLVSDNDIDLNNNNNLYYTFTVPADTVLLRAQTVGNDPDADIYIQRQTGWNSWNTVCSATGNSSNETCDVSNPQPGSYRVRVFADSTFNNVSLTVTAMVSQGDFGCAPVSSSSYGWGGCTYATPSGRSEADEFTNYATWFSYHRTRMKVAKSGASAAFAQLGNNVRVGFRTIHNRNTFNIPVDDGNDGIFEGSSRGTWFGRLFGALGRSNTPLRASLYDVGEYFSDSSATGPYGPASAGDQLACRQNFAILTTDGFWNGSIGSRSIGDQDGTSGSAIYNPEDDTTAVRYSRSHPYQDTGSSTNYSNTLADVAMKYWKTDLRPDLDNIVPPGAQNPAFWQHMVTFGISIGLKGTLDQGSVAQVLQDGRPRRNGNDVDWPDPTDAENAERIDDLLHAAVNGHGEFIAATSAEQFRDSLTAVLGQIQSRLASGSNVATNSTTFQSDTRAFQATYRTGSWTGELSAYSVTRSGGIASTPDWRVTDRIAATYADNQSGNDFHNRVVRTWDTSGAGGGAAFPTAAQSTLLTRSTGPAPVTGANNAAYIKGDQSLELARGGVLRNRTTVLGDIINSSPFYIRDTETIYVGANDGMLHGIDALNGNVLFSYVPAGVNFAKLATLSDPAYTHGFFVDGPVTVSSYRVQSGKNYLVGTLGRGGKGAFALDVSDVRHNNANSRFTNSHVLWDHTATTDADMGYVTGLPLIVRGNNDVVLAIVPNGIDSANGSATLYVYNVTNGNQLAKIVADSSGGNGLASPRAADLDGDGKADYIYAGDLRGNVWKFDFTSNNPNSWGVDADVGGPLFVATDANGDRQPITGGIALAREPGTNKIWLTFGTGKLITISDLSSTDIQTWYGIIDDDAAIGRDDLTAREIAIVGTNADGRPVRAFEEFSELPDDSMGWYVDLDEPTPGERVVSGARVSGRAAFVSSVIPSAGDGCEAGGGGYLNAIDMFTGTSAEGSEGGGSASFFDVDGSGTGADDTITDGDGNTLPIGSIDLGIGMPTESSQIEDLVLVCGSDGTCEEVPAAPGATGVGQPRRTSWREIFGD